MTTSGVSAFELTLNQIVTDAYSLAQVLADGETLTASQLVQGRNSLNMMVKSWQTENPLWGWMEGTVTCVAGQEHYVLGDGGDFAVRPMKIKSVRRRQLSGLSNIDTPMLPIMRDEYENLPQKSSTGIPNQYYYSPYNFLDETKKFTQGLLFIWPTLAAGQQIELKFTYQRELDIFASAGNTPDLPQEWSECLTYNLAVRVGQRYGQGVEDDIILMAQQLKIQMLGWDKEESIYISPVGYGGYGWPGP